MIDYLELFDTSFARVTAKNRGEDFFESFYQRFILADPLVAEKFSKTDLGRQREMLRESLSEMRTFYTEHTRTPYLALLGKIHGRTGHNIEPRLYDLWLECLTATVAAFDHYDAATNADIDAAWRVVLAPGIAFMKAHHSR